MVPTEWFEDVMRFKGFWSASFSDKCKWIPLALFLYILWVVYKIEEFIEILKS